MPKLRLHGEVDANCLWTSGERTAALRLVPAHFRAAVALMANTGRDPSDALHLQRDAISDGLIWARRAKTGAEVPLPIGGALRAGLDDAPKHDALTILPTTKGLPWTYSGFSTVWPRFKVKQVDAGNIPPDLTLKNLRHTEATLLRKGGVQRRKIADPLGKKTESMALHYSRNAIPVESIRATMATSDSEAERRTKITKPFENNVKPD